MSGKGNKSQIFHPEEVLAYLNQLGYTNINSELLKEFLTDLKRLIKYQKKREQIQQKHESKCETPSQESYCGALNGSGQISIKLKKPQCCMTTETVTSIITPIESSSIKETSTKETLTPKESSAKATSSTGSKIELTSKQKQKSRSAKSVKSVNRRDPVALYHHYQSEWKKIKLPGEDNHTELRRFVRDKLTQPTSNYARSIRSRSVSRTRSCHC